MVTFNFCSPRKEIDRKISQEYQGVVLEKFNRHGTMLKIKTNSGKIIEEGTLDATLTYSVVEGDSIYKIKEKNVCVVKHKGIKSLYRYAFDRDDYEQIGGGILDREFRLKPEKRIKQDDYIEYLR